MWPILWEHNKKRKETKTKRETDSSHSIHCRFTKFMSEIIAFNEAYTMLASHGSLHLDSPLDHPMDDSFNSFALCVAK